MDETTRIFIEKYFEKHKRTKNAKWLSDLIARAYNIKREDTCKGID